VKNKIAVIGATAGVFAAAAAGLAIGVPTLAGAQSNPAVTVASTGTTTAPVDGEADRATALQNVLAPLVKDGTITQAQADKVIEALQAAKPAGPFGGRHGRGEGMFGASLDTVAGALGMPVDELRTALQSGQTIAAVATSKNVELQTVIDALVAERKTALDQAVTNGRITQAQADARLAAATTEITAIVNGERPLGGKGGFGGPGGPGGRHDGPWSPTEPSTATGTDD
jgi:hypothetical protein